MRNSTFFNKPMVNEKFAANERCQKYFFSMEILREFGVEEKDILKALQSSKIKNVKFFIEERNLDDLFPHLRVIVKKEGRIETIALGCKVLKGEVSITYKISRGFLTYAIYQEENAIKNYLLALDEGSIDKKDALTPEELQAVSQFLQTNDNQPVWKKIATQINFGIYSNDYICLPLNESNTCFLIYDKKNNSGIFSALQLRQMLKIHNDQSEKKEMMSDFCDLGENKENVGPQHSKPFM